MGKRSGSRSSRSERRAERQRAERARDHGLPARPLSSPPAGGSQTQGALDAPREHSPESGAAPSSRSGFPLLAKVLILAFVILLGVYLLGRQRDKALLQGATPSAAVRYG